ncbi:hypothetical protein B566_EDAN010457 [Ephemera danica]|nr:hypothetical protein B566_EDAN010457 [Ephemera danica]
MKGLVKNMQQQQQQQQESNNQQFSGIGYISEKLYLLLQLYLQNKSWNPSVELLQMVANRVTLDNQGRLVLRDNGKIILPFEHFANAVMESYTVGRDNFGMEKDFVIEVVQNCPNPTCRFYKSQMDQLTQKSLQHLSSQAAAAFHTAETNISNASFPTTVGSAVDLTERVAAVSSRGHLAPPSAPQAVTQEADQADRLAEFLRANFDSLDGIPGAKKIVRTFSEIMKNMSRMKTCVRPSMCKPYGKQSEALQKSLFQDFLALQNGVWPMFETDKRGAAIEGQEKIVRTFSEIMKNMSRMKTCVRPSMCKPYGKQSEALQKITSWKEEEHKHRQAMLTSDARYVRRPGSKSSLRTLGKPPDSGQLPSSAAAAAALLADNLQHLVRPKKYE